MRRTLGIAGMLALGFVVLAGCEPAPPPAPPAPRTLRFEIAEAGPYAVGMDDDGAPVALGSTQPTVEVVAFYPACTPISQSGSFAFHKALYADEGGTYDAWYIDGGSLTAVVPGDAQCLPTDDGMEYLLTGEAATLDPNGPVGPSVFGMAFPTWMSGFGYPTFRIIK